MSSLRLAQRRLERDDFNIQRYITGALGGAERAANLVARLLALSRQQPLSPQRTDVNRLLSGMEEVLRRTIPESIRMEFVRVEAFGASMPTPMVGKAQSSFGGERPRRHA